MIITQTNLLEISFQIRPVEEDAANVDHQAQEVEELYDKKRENESSSALIKNFTLMSGGKFKTITNAMW